MNVKFKRHKINALCTSLKIVRIRKHFNFILVTNLAKMIIFSLRTDFFTAYICISFPKPKLFWLSKLVNLPKKSPKTQKEESAIDKLEVLYEGSIEVITEMRHNVSKINYFITHKQHFPLFQYNGYKINKKKSPIYTF